MNSRNNEDKLIEIIYETALDPGLWPIALEGLSSALETSENASTEAALSTPNIRDSIHDIADPNAVRNTIRPRPYKMEAWEQFPLHEDHRLYEKIRPHLTRAIQLRLKLQTLEKGSTTLTNLIDRISLGVLVVDAKCQLIFANTLAQNLVNAEDTFTLIGNSIKLCNTAANREFRQHVAELIASNPARVYSMSLENSEREHISLMIARLDYSHNNTPAPTIPATMVLVTPPLRFHELHHSTLKSIYGFTPSETKVANALIRGEEPKRIASKLGVSIYTIRSQLSAMYAKTGAKRQAELIGLLVKCTATPPPRPAAACPHRHSPKEKGHPLVYAEHCIKLSDGRQLGYAEYGNPDGLPVIHCHNMYGCRYEVPPSDNALIEHGLRLIVPDRPGVGLSDPVYFDRYADWVPDLVQLADHLGISSFPLTGFGTGGNFALAAAWYLPNRVRNVTVISPTLPISTIEGLKLLAPPHRMIMSLCGRLPGLAVKIYSYLIKGAARDPVYYFRDVLAADRLERSVIDRPEVKNNIRLCIDEIVAQEPSGTPHEIRYIVKPWEFELRKIRQPVHFWRGQLDGHAPIPLAEELMAGIPHASIDRIQDQSFLLIYTNWKDIISRIRDFYYQPALVNRAIETQALQ